MTIINIHAFLLAYFKIYHCEIIKNKDGVLTVQLTEELDKTLMNRPFYWHYIKSTGNIGEPMTLTLITNPDRREEDGEWIHFGSPRLQQIFNHLQSDCHPIKVFQDIKVTDHTALHPWLVTNIKVSYSGKQNKEELFSIGLNLINGQMKTKMMNFLDSLTLSNTISDYCYPISPLIKLKSGFKRIENVIYDYISNQSHDWAKESTITLQEEIEVAKHFFKPNNLDTELANEINDLTKRYTPSVSIDVIHCGLLYIHPSST